ncbi:hypothetical protein NDU88_007297 [Pleurodeles waltl]|uniref:Uncharacterized protein n=1 Tax=Pleurodeles waltl TaxID=8319 RepID=A0AAV7QRF9_PLEWA|nr:hypothetical protein NDU88_007297 [Pleurodeles waltl]
MTVPRDQKPDTPGAQSTAGEQEHPALTLTSGFKWKRKTDKEERCLSKESRIGEERRKSGPQKKVQTKTHGADCRTRRQRRVP